MRNNMEGFRAADFVIERGFRLGTVAFVPADNHAVDADSPPYMMLDPAGAIDMLMPAATEALKGLTFVMANVSANAITLKTSGDAAFTTAIVIAGGETAIVTCTGSATAALGWRSIATAAST